VGTAKDEKVPAILLRKGGPAAVVFIASGCLMVVEIVAGRLISGFLGASLYTWTSVIGVVLAGITVGNHTGGRLADRYPPEKLIGRMLLGAALGCASILLLGYGVREADLFSGMTWPVRIGLSVAAIFFLPSCVLGTISPVVMTATLRHREEQGRTVGALHASGAAGSVAGTFLAGFVLLGLYGTTSIIWGVAGCLALLSLLFVETKVLQLMGAAVAGIGLAAAVTTAQGDGWVVSLVERPDGSVVEERVEYEKDSDYFRIMVTPAKRFASASLSKEFPDARVLLLDAMVHGMEIPGRPEVLIYKYEQLTALLTHEVGGGRPIRTAFIGGGAYSFPRFLEATHPPGTVIDVVEIDPAVTEAVHEALGMPRSTRIKSYNEDARIFVKRSRGVRYDIVYGDAFNGFSIPSHLTTVEFVREVRAILDPKGAYILNIVDSPTSLRLVGSVHRTLREVFPEIAIYTVTGDHERKTFVLFATLEPRDLSAVDAKLGPDAGALRLGPSEVRGLDARGVVLTDEFAPVDQLIAPIYADRRSY
jgi:predicted membrane-bound spermidine synthase